MISTSSLRLDDLYNLRGRVALVTGGGTGIGWMIARAMAMNGATVYITGRRKDVLENAVTSYERQDDGGEILPLVMDVTDRESITSARKEIQDREGKLHILINNAGIPGPIHGFFGDPSAPEQKDAETLGQAMFDAASYDDWTNVHKTNTFAIYFVTMAFLGLLVKGGEETTGFSSCVVNITSVAGVAKLAQCHFAYNTSKAGAAHLTKLLAAEFALKKFPVRVCAVAPGVFQSELGGNKSQIPDHIVDQFYLGVAPVPLQRVGSEQEMAGTVLYLVSRAGCFMTGQEIVIDGWFTAVNPARQ